MDLSWWLTTLSLAALAYAVGTWLYGAYIAPRASQKAAQKATEGAKSVRALPKRRAFRQRSRGSNVQNPVNAGSGHQEEPEPPVNVQNVQVPPAAPGAAASADAASDEGFTLSARELVQLAEALHLRGEGATVEECLSRAFGVSKGGSEGYRRAKSLWDAATALPGSAPSGTYQQAPPPARRRRAAR